MSAAAASRLQQKARNMEPFWWLVGHNVMKDFDLVNINFLMALGFNYNDVMVPKRRIVADVFEKRLFLRVKWSSKLDSVIDDH